MITKKLGVQIMIAGLALQIVDVATSGKVFGPSGWLEPIDSKVPKFTLPWPTGVQTNLAGVLIAIGAVIFFVKR